MSYKTEINKIEGYNPNTKQEEYYNRMISFMNSNDDVLFNPGGMGLGKTIASVLSIKNTINPTQFLFVGCPTAPLKSVWAKDMNLAGLNSQYMMWFSKTSCCIKKKQNPKFDVQKNCKDDCEFWSNQETNGERKEKLFDNLKRLDKRMPLFPTEYYECLGCESCLLPITRYGLKKRQYLVGDYFGFLNGNAFDKIMNSREEFNKNRANGIVLIDEAHLLPERAKDYLSKTLNLSSAIVQLDKEIHCDYTLFKPELLGAWEDTISVFKEIESHLIRNKKANEERFTYANFYDLYDSLIKDNAFNFNILKEELRKLAEYGHKYSFDSYETQEDPFCAKLWLFLEMWQEKSNDPLYKTKFQYKNINNRKIRFVIDCCDTSHFLKEVFSKWDKVILNSGTLPDIEHYKFQTGIDFYNTRYEDMIESYSVKENVILYGRGRFVSSSREKTYEEEGKTLNKIINKLKGRTIIYIQNKSYSRLLKELLKSNSEVVDFCSKDDGMFTSQEDFNQLCNYFNGKEKAIAIMNINGRVEGFNFESIIDSSSVDNIIIFGYPYPVRNLSYQDTLEYYTSKIGNSTKARAWIDFAPVMNRIHQAVCRAKRKESDKPTIILWGDTFTADYAYRYMPEDLRGEIIYDEVKLTRRIDNGK